MDSKPVTRYVFVHDRRDWLLAALLIAIGLNGGKCTVIGTTEYNGIGGCDQSISFGELESAVNSLQTYRSFSAAFNTPTVNDVNYEKLCFDRWFYLYAYASQSNEGLLYLDSDYLLSPEFSADRLPNGLHSFYDTAFINSLSELNGLGSFLDYLVQVQVDSKLSQGLSLKYSVQGRPHLSDMHCLIEYGLRSPDQCYQLTGQMLGIGLCPNVSTSGGYISNGLTRSMYFNESRSSIYCIKQSCGSLTSFFSIHMQGLSKILAPAFMPPALMLSSVWDGKSLYGMYLTSILERRAYWETDLGEAFLELAGLSNTFVKLQQYSSKREWLEAQLLQCPV